MRELNESGGRPGDAVASFPLEPGVPGCSIRNIAVRRLDRTGKLDLRAQVRHWGVVGGGQCPFDCRNTLAGLAAARTAIDVRAKFGGLPLNKRAAPNRAISSAFGWRVMLISPKWSANTAREAPEGGDVRTASHPS